MGHGKTSLGVEKFLHDCDLFGNDFTAVEGGRVPRCRRALKTFFP